MRTCHDQTVLGRYRLTAMAATLAIPGLVAAAGSLSTSRSAATRPTNPHWQPDGCASCHQVEQGKPLAISAKQADEICLGCHDGQRARAESHPIGRVLKDDEFVRPQGWPLVDDRLGCLTCHDAFRACNRSARRSPVNPAFLRGQNIDDRHAFCANCHRGAPYKEFNPHLMLTEGNVYRLEACRFCHLPKFRSKQLGLCRTCHVSHVDWFQPGHIGTEIPADVQAYMAARELTRPTIQPSRELIGRLKSSGVEPTRRRPDPDGKVVCTSCHNPHLEGVFPADHRMAYGAMKLVAPNQVVSPVRTQQFCLTCHDI